MTYLGTDVHWQKAEGPVVITELLGNQVANSGLLFFISEPREGASWVASKVLPAESV